MDLEQVKAVLQDARLLVSEAELMAAFDQMAVSITTELKDLNPIALPVMNGALLSAAELAKRLNFPIQFDYIHATRYRGRTIGGEHIHWLKEPTSSLENRNVLIIDDVLDGGQTLHAIVEFCYARRAKKVYTAVTLDKPTGRSKMGLKQADFVGLEIPDEFVFGFGLDYHGYLRNLPAVYAVAKHHLV